ncbi:TlpA family protein disulfide reductase [Nocardioides mesophilus]|uniref:TlpA family protein disulfide reductase n=1 Tax=Nocardioides mesophilus TaxID=433659 RepID=A0A7G9R6N7_9ACTN|nr:TlpA disulfide reductase family protein [Nocardioides mesophilus]QNN51262.1 TlpA family protein disulfide reductase [Nocardioides mesophilus]
MTPSLPPRRRTRAAAALAGLAVAATLTGCSSDVGSSGEQGFVSGAGIITTLPAAEREAPGEVSGTTIDGEPLALSDYAGQVVVVNVWGSWCGPCRGEAPMLADAARDLAAKDVAFLGIDSRDPDRAQARAFVRTFDIPYPSIYDQQGRTLLAFRGTLVPNAIPSTVIIDREGRVAASVQGPITRTTLYDLVEEVQGGEAS